MDRVIPASIPLAGRAEQRMGLAVWQADGTGPEPAAGSFLDRAAGARLRLVLDPIVLLEEGSSGEGRIAGRFAAVPRAWLLREGPESCPADSGMSGDRREGMIPDAHRSGSHSWSDPL